MTTHIQAPKNLIRYCIKNLIWFIIGGFLAALSIEVFLIPNQLIDGGIVGLSIIGSYLTSRSLLPLFLVVLNLPFIYLAFRFIGKIFVLQMLMAITIFAAWLVLFSVAPDWFGTPHFAFHGDALEVIVLGGFILGSGFGLIIRYGGSTDGTEILGIIANRKKGFTVGQVVLVVNIAIFALAGVVYQNWHSAFQSLLTYVVATKIMDIVIVGFDETKSVMVISSVPEKLAHVLIERLGVGLTVMYGRGGYSGDAREILYIVVERLQLSELKAIIQREDPQAFVAVETLHEVINGRQSPN